MQRREDAITRLGLFERTGDPGLASLCRLAAYVCGADAAAVHIVDNQLQRRIAGENAPLGNHSRADSMCRLVVDSEQRIVCADATADPRFGYSSFVSGPAPVRFYLSVPLRSTDGVVLGTLCAFDTRPAAITDEQLARFEDVADQVVAQIELQRIAVDLGHRACQDPLTGVANRIVLADRLSAAFARRQRHGGQTVLAVIDINHFKAINDEWGHSAGDEVLVQVARRLTESIRAEDTVARVGGDEFVILAEVEDLTEFAHELTERIARALAEPIVCAGRRRRIGAALGCIHAEPGESMSDALERADREMYAHKLVEEEDRLAVC